MTQLSSRYSSALLYFTTGLICKMTLVVSNPFVSRKKCVNTKTQKIIITKKYIFEIVCQGKMFFSPEHKKKLQVLHIVLDFTSSTSIKHVLAYIQGNTETQGLALYIFTIHKQHWGIEDVRNIRETMVLYMSFEKVSFGCQVT